MAALSVYMSASPADAAFAGRLRQAIINAGGRIVSAPPSPSSSPSPSPSAPAPSTSPIEPESQRELRALDGARAYVAVLSPAALASPQVLSEAGRYDAVARGDSKRKVVPVQLEPLPPDAAVPALQRYAPVTGPYGTPELQDALIAETLRQLGLPVQRAARRPDRRDVAPVGIAGPTQ
jgi:hypothetical protein